MLLPSKATLAEASNVLAALQAALASGTGPLRIDASALQHFDTSLVALLLQARRTAQAAGRSVELVGTPPKLTDLARLYGVESLLSPATPGSSPA